MGGVDIESIQSLKANIPASLPYRTTLYVSKEGDTFEILSTRVYRDPLQYWRIADLNPQVKYPDVIPAGTLIRLPS